MVGLKASHASIVAFGSSVLNTDYGRIESERAGAGVPAP